MHQQVNLYQDVFREKKQPFSATAMFTLLIFFVLVFGGIYAFSAYRLGNVESTLASLETGTRELREQVDQLHSQIPGKTSSRILSAELKRLQDELRARQAVSTALTQHAIENKRSFSSMLESLARKHVQGTWLTRVFIGDAGEALGFEGKTYSSELVPQYIQQLAEEPAFAGLSFNELELRRSAGDAVNLEFLVHSRAGQLQ